MTSPKHLFLYQTYVSCHLIQKRSASQVTSFVRRAKDFIIDNKIPQTFVYKIKKDKLLVGSVEIFKRTEILSKSLKLRFVFFSLRFESLFCL